MLNTKYTVCSLWLAKELEERGFECIETGKNQKKPEFNVFYFKDTAELRNEVNRIMEENQSGKISKSKNCQSM